MRFIVFLLFFSFGAIAYSQIPGYYQGLNLTLTGQALKNQLAQIITQTHTTYIDYNTAWTVLQGSDLDPSNPSDTIVLLVYGYDDLDALTINDRTRSKNKICNFTGNCNGYWNREHIYAQSLATPPLATDPPGAGTDAHNLRAIDVQMNSTRNNRRYTDGTGNSGQSGQDFYPGDEWRGDVARVIMYMYLRYNTQCLPVNVGNGTATWSTEIPNIFLEWNVEDPVSQLEQNRNDSIFEYQGNRNPFIDNPYLATLIWSGPAAQNFWNLDGSDIIRDPSFSEPALIPYLTYQENNNLTPAISIATGRFRIRDGGPNGDGDNLPTVIQQLDFQLTGHQAIRRIALYSGNTELSEVAVTGQIVSFQNLNLVVADNDSVAVTLRCSYTTSVTDHLQTAFQVHYVQTSSTGSSMAFANGGGATTLSTNNKNVLNVIASTLVFTVGPTDVLTFTPMTPAIVLACRDAAGNTDTDYTQAVTLSASMSFGSGATTVTVPVNGLATFSNVHFDASNRTVTIQATSGILTMTESTVFAVTEILLGWELTGLTGYGPSPFTPTVNAAGLLSDGWTRGSGMTTGGTAALNAWGGNGTNTASASAALTANDLVLFSAPIPAGKVLSARQIRPYNIRISSSGATQGQWQYRINNGAFINLGSPITWGPNTTSAGNLQSAISLQSIPALQNLASGSSLTFRILLWGASTTTGNWYLNAFQTGIDMALEGFWENGSQPTDYFRSRTSGQWDNASTWESSADGISWYAATLFPGQMAQSILIRNTHTVLVSNAQSARNLTAGPGAQLIIATGAILTTID